MLQVRHRLLSAAKHRSKGGFLAAVRFGEVKQVCVVFFLQPVMSEHGLLTTVAYKLGRDKPARYALEVQRHSTRQILDARFPKWMTPPLLPLVAGFRGHRWSRGALAAGQPGDHRVVARARCVRQCLASAPLRSHAVPLCTEQLAAMVGTSYGCYFVPAFSGLYAPYWEPSARG